MEETEIEFAKLPSPTDVYSGEKIFRKIINKKAKATIPEGRIKQIYPEMPAEAILKMKERDTLRENDPQSPLLNQLNSEITDCITKHKRNKWRETVENTSMAPALGPTTTKPSNSKENISPNQIILPKN
jgi:hypothetical protein